MPRAATGPMPRAATGPMPRAATGPRPRPGAGAPSGDWETPVPQSPRAPRAPRASGAPRAPRANGRHRDGGQLYGDRRPQWQAPRDAADWTERDGGNVEWNYDLPPWDGGAPEPDPGFRYREPGPGMPGYRGSRNPYRGGDNLR
jgi:hypothetical protein